MRGWLLAALVAGCTPSVDGGAYYCGPDEACPPETACDGTTNLCVAPADRTDFTCTEGPALGSPGCLAGTLSSTGCVMGATAIDRVALTTAACPMHYSITLSFPDAFMPLVATIRDPAGAAIATSAPCGTLHGGQISSCVELDGAASTAYTIEVAAAPGAQSCDGACAFNRYALAVNITTP